MFQIFMNLLLLETDLAKGLSPFFCLYFSLLSEAIFISLWNRLAQIYIFIKDWYW